MRIFFCLLFVVAFNNIGLSQDKIVSYNEPELDSLSDEAIDIERKHAWAAGFTQIINKMGEPSIGSFFWGDKTINLDPAKQKKNFVVNTTVQPIVGIGGKRWYIKNYVHTFQVQPVLGIRIFQNDSAFQDHSLPVRTPNFSIRLNYYFSHASLWNDSSHCKIYFGLTGFHTSNGQDGYEYVVDVTKNDSVVNTYNGNFSEPANLEFMIGGLKMRPKAISSETRNKARSPRRLLFNNLNSFYYWKAAFELHPKFSTAEKFSRYNLYGRKRLNLQFGYIFNPSSKHVTRSRKSDAWIPLEKNYHSREVRRLVINLSYILDGKYNISPFVRQTEFASMFNIEKRLNIDFTWYERIGTVSDYAIFVRLGYYGSDPYNIYFRESIYVARIGLAFGNFAYGEKR
jgi:hypothetical protein